MVPEAVLVTKMSAAAEIFCLSVTLKWPTGLLVDVNDDAIRITRQINPNVNDDLGHLLVDLRLWQHQIPDKLYKSIVNLLLWFRLADVRLELAGDGCDLPEETKLTVVERACLVCHLAHDLINHPV